MVAIALNIVQVVTGKVSRITNGPDTITIDRYQIV